MTARPFWAKRRCGCGVAEPQSPSLLADYTTLRVGGAAEAFVEAATADNLIAAAREAWSSGGELFILGGGSNVVVSDEGFDGTVLRVATRGIARVDAEPGVVRLTVQAGEPWDDLVAYTVEQGWAGIEALSGIPGTCGAAPIQNIGAYGQEIATAVIGIDFVDEITGELVWLSTDELEFGYRTSVLKEGRGGVVVAVHLALTEAPGGGTVAFAQLATALGVTMGAAVPLAEVRSAVLALRAGKGMVLDAADPDSVSAGSFFTNPIVGVDFARGLPAELPRWPIDVVRAVDVVTPLDRFALNEFSGEVASLPEAPRTVKLSAAWLIEHSGVTRGFSLPGSRAAVSSKHTLALINTGGATANDVAELARYIQTRVLGRFGVVLHPEPVFVGLFA